MNTREKDLKSQCVVSMDSSKGQCSIVNPGDAKAPPKNFTFDGAYFTDSTTENIYADIAYPLVEVSHTELFRRLKQTIAGFKWLGFWLS